ncbi:BTB/POZ domain-containing protein 7 [Hyposmocoma kahamanoa]|uniref:BTB/POZ domain-containing protein 7 n=1 Tax=Hyposmocoma kahamanoa TaxID=1477025 RepID=UPI000E6D9A4B|nr:BTB/POZ domain-containing protein 7 [Hyposmocoma kahamanoa]
MGAALSHPQDGEACDGAVVVVEPPTMADVIRERKKKAGGAGLGTLRRRLAAAARRPRDARPDRGTGCEHARFIRGVVASWRLAEVRVLCEELEAGAALRDLATQAELAREPAPRLHADLAKAMRDRRWYDVELVGSGWSVRAHRAVLASRCSYFRDLLAKYPSGSVTVALDGVGANLSREEMELVLVALYAGASNICKPHHHDFYQWGGLGSDNDLDIINVDNTGTCRQTSSICGCGVRRDSNLIRRLSATLGFSLDTLHRDMKYLLDSGEHADAKLVFRQEGGSFGFRFNTEMRCHRVILAARSRFFRSVMVRRVRSVCENGRADTGTVCVDEKVLPQRFARALLHAAYTDQVDLSLIGRNSPSPSSTNSTASSNVAWAGAARGGALGGGGGPGGGGGSLQRGSSHPALEDAFQLYEIARFLEMPIVVQGCEDAIVEALSPETLPLVLRWAANTHASQWVHRQAMRYLRDEFPLAMAAPAAARLPLAALGAALASPFLQASEAQALRALLRWGERAAQAQARPEREPNVVWHTHRAQRRRDVSDAALRELLAPLLPLLRTEHLPPDHDQLQQAIRRGILPQPPPQLAEEGSAADAWLGRGSYRPPRCFLPYLDEIKALLEHQAVPEAEVALARRTRYVHRIPDTLYMVAEARGAGAGAAAGAASLEGAWSRAQRAAQQHAERALQQRNSQQLALMNCARPRPDEDEFIAAIELSVIRAYSSYQPNANPTLANSSLAAASSSAGGAGVGGVGRCRAPQLAHTATLPHCFRSDLTPFANSVLRRATPSPSSLSASSSAHLSGAAGGAGGSAGAARHAPDHAPHLHNHHLAARRVSSAEGRPGSHSHSRSPSPSPGASPRRQRRDYPVYRHHDFRPEAYGGGGGGSRGHSPSNYA